MSNDTTGYAKKLKGLIKEQKELMDCIYSNLRTLIDKYKDYENGKQEYFRAVKGHNPDSPQSQQ